MTTPKAARRLLLPEQKAMAGQHPAYSGATRDVDVPTLAGPGSRTRS